MPTDPFIEHTAALRGLGGRRVWSLMISLFGDLAQDKGAVIDGPVLSAIMAGLRVKPEAARVALHRLRNDGWIRSEKSGRISQHSLSAKGRAECAQANPLIYAAPDTGDGDWQLVLLPENGASPEEMARQGFTEVMPRVFVAPLSAQPPADALQVQGQEVPDWFRKQSAPLDLHEGYTDRLHTLETLSDALPEAEELTPIEVAVLRCLIVHNWRRLVLKHPALPAALVDPDGPSHRCQIAVHDLLTRFPRPRLREIAQFRDAA